jgi:hypothetical protein
MHCRRAKLGFLCFLALLNLDQIAYAQNNQPPGNPPGKCLRPAKEYDGYKVADVRIDSPLGWLFPSVTQRLNELLADPQMPLKKGERFSRDDFYAGFIFLNTNFPALQVNPFNRVAVRLAGPSLADCDEGKRTLIAVYRVYHLGVPDLLTSSFERRDEELATRSVVETPATERLANFFPQPFTGYNRSRDLFGGARLTINQPGDIFDKITLNASGSASSLFARAEMHGSRNFMKGALRHAEWRVGHRYSDTPSDAMRLKESATVGQIAVATRPIGAAGLIVRFGGAVEGGHQQTDADQPRLPPTDLARTGYASGKTFVGATLRAGRLLFERPLELRLKGSYGLQVGNAGEGRRVDYVKQLFDTAAQLRYRLRDHRPLSLETQFTFGSINTPGRLPTPERFFGGNVEQNFIAGESWTIRSQPFIRSIPQSMFARVDQNGPAGGDRFFAVNLTLAATVWGRPLTPSEILNDDEFTGVVELALSASQSEIESSYVSKSPELREIARQVVPMEGQLKDAQQDLDDLQEAARQLGDQEPGPAILRQIALCRADLRSVTTSVTAVAQKLEKNSLDRADVRILLVGIPDLAPPRPSRIEKLNKSLGALAGLADLPVSGVIADKIKSLQTLGARLEAAREILARDFTNKLEKPGSTVVAAAKQQAEKDMRYPRRVLNELLYEANLIGVSPVLVFDAARLQQRGSTAGDVRYALGGGLRLSIVSVDLTVGYAWNLRPKPWEGRGALIFTMAVSNLFR